MYVDRRIHIVYMMLLFIRLVLHNYFLLLLIFFFLVNPRLLIKITFITWSLRKEYKAVWVSVCVCGSVGD